MVGQELAAPADSGIVLELDCPLCGHHGQPTLEMQDGRLHVEGRFTYARCQTCEVYWLVNRFDREHAHLAYPVTEYYSFNEKPPGEDRVQRALRARYQGGPVLRRLHGRMLQAYPPAGTRGAVLDVGCGTGSRLHRLKALGWLCAGAERSGDAVTAARSNGLDVRHGTAEDLPFDDTSVDVVLLAHCIEHCHDPVLALREVRRVLKPGGWIVVTTPNTRSVLRKVWGRHWVHWEPSRHLVLFERRSLTRLLRNEGFVVARTRGSASGAGLIDSLLLCFGYPRPGRVQTLCRMGAAALCLMTNWHPWADEMEIVARRR